MKEKTRNVFDKYYFCEIPKCQTRQIRTKRLPINPRYWCDEIFKSWIWKEWPRRKTPNKVFWEALGCLWEALTGLGGPRPPEGSWKRIIAKNKKWKNEKNVILLCVFGGRCHQVLQIAASSWVRQTACTPARVPPIPKTSRQNPNR